MNKINCILINDDNESDCITDDNNSEKCWKEKYKGESRKWLIRDASPKIPCEPISSTMKESYRHIRPQEKITEIIGRKRELLLKQFEQEAINEVIEECNKPPIVEKYCTEYDTSFSMPGFEPDDELFKKQKDLYEKYPLYRSIPTSYYSYKVVKQQPREMLHGFTPVFDEINPFKKSTEFSKPINDVLDYSSK